MRTLTRGPYSVRYEGSLLYYGIAFRFNTKAFCYSVNIALNITSTVAKNLTRKNLIQRPRDHLIYQFLCLLLFPALFLLLLLYRVFFMTLLAYSLE